MVKNDSRVFKKSMNSLDNDVQLLINYSKKLINDFVKIQNKSEICIVSAIFGGSDQIDFLINNFKNLNYFTFVFTDEENLSYEKFSNHNFKIIYIPEAYRLENPRKTAKIFKVFYPLSVRIFLNRQFGWTQT